MERIYIDQLSGHKGKEIIINGWVDIRRDHGKLIFIDLRDVSEKVQMVVLPNHKEAQEKANAVRNEWCLKVTGKVNERPEKMRKEGLNGDLEIEVLDIEVLSESKTPPFEVNTDTIGIDEEMRLEYRYLDLRSDRMKKNIQTRDQYIQNCRDYLHKNRFTEIETPLLTESTPEGSRDFVVLSRLMKGKFYALPQSPQQYKQLLMVSGLDRYFQLARCLRDEDLRADRGFEHTQIDIEMSFITRDEIMKFIEGMITEAVEKMGYTIKTKPFPVITYQESMEKYGADKFDARTEEDKKNGILAYHWVVDFPFFEKGDDGKWTFTHNPFSMPKPEHLEWHMKGENIEKILTTQYDIICNGHEVGGGSIRAHRPEILKATYKTMGYSEEEIEGSVGHMLKAFEFGAPPHGGIGMGVERTLMNLMREDALKEVQAFPMTRKGQTAVMNAPKELTPKQLAELGIMTIKKEGEE